MKKELIREYEGKLIMVDVILYLIIITLGYISINIFFTTELQQMNYIYSLFYIIGFFSIICYFVNRRREGYELLAFGFINITIATFVLAYNYFGNIGFILSDAVIIYTIANAINKFYHIDILYYNNDVNFIIKLLVSALLTVLGFYLGITMYDKVDTCNLLIGYYFLVYGALSLIEPLTELLLRNVELENKVRKVLKFNYKEKKEKNKLKKVKSKKIVKKIKSL